MTAFRRWLVLVAPAVGGCLPPTIVTSFTDGRLPERGQHDAALGFLAGQDVEPDEIVPPQPSAYVAGGAGWTVGLGRRVALHAGAAASGLVAGPGQEGTQAVLHGQAELQIGVGEGPLQTVLLVGTHGAVLLPGEPWVYGGVDTGALLAGDVHPKLRLFGTMRLGLTLDGNRYGPYEAEEPVRVYLAHPVSFGASVPVTERTTLGAELLTLPPSWGRTEDGVGRATPWGLAGALWLRGRFGKAADPPGARGNGPGDET